MIQTVAGVSENHNHANYQARLDYVKQVVGSHLGLSEKVGRQRVTQARTQARAQVPVIIIAMLDTLGLIFTFSNIKRQ